MHLEIAWPLCTSFLARAAPHTPGTRCVCDAARARAPSQKGRRPRGRHARPAHPTARAPLHLGCCLRSGVCSDQHPGGGHPPAHEQGHPTSLRILGTPTSVTFHAHRDPSQKTAGVTCPAAPRARINQTPSPGSRPPHAVRQPWDGQAAGQGLPPSRLPPTAGSAIPTVGLVVPQRQLPLQAAARETKRGHRRQPGKNELPAPVRDSCTLTHQAFHETSRAAGRTRCSAGGCPEPPGTRPQASRCPHRCFPNAFPRVTTQAPGATGACPELNRTWHSRLHTQHAPRMPCRPRRCSQGPGMGRTCVRDLWAPVNGGAGMVISECPSQRDMAELDRGPMGPSPGQGRHPPAAIPHKPPAPALNVRWRQCPSELWECKEKASVAWLPVNPQTTTMRLWRGPRVVCRLCAETTSV